MKRLTLVILSMLALAGCRTAQPENGFLAISELEESVFELRPQGCYTLTGVYSDGFVFDETGNVWEYYAYDAPGFSAGTETPVIINFHGFGTPELKDDVILGLSYGCMTEVYYSGYYTHESDGVLRYHFVEAGESGDLWFFTEEELGFSPEIDDQIMVCHADGEVIYTRVL